MGFPKEISRSSLLQLNSDWGSQYWFFGKLLILDVLLTTHTEGSVTSWMTPLFHAVIMSAWPTGFSYLLDLHNVFHNSPVYGGVGEWGLWDKFWFNFLQVDSEQHNLPACLLKALIQQQFSGISNTKERDVVSLTIKCYITSLVYTWTHVLWLIWFLETKKW